MENIERRKGYIQSVDLNIDEISKVISLTDKAFQGSDVQYFFEVECEDLSEHESRSKTFLEDSRTLLESKNINSISIRISSDDHTFIFILKHGEDLKYSYFSVESNKPNIVDSYFTKIENQFEYLNRDDKIQVTLAYIASGIYTFLLIISLIFMYWAFNLDYKPNNWLEVFWKYLLKNPIFHMSFGLAFTGMMFFSDIKKRVLYPHVSIVTGKRGKRQKIFKNISWKAIVFLFITLIPSIFSYKSKSEMPLVKKEQSIEYAIEDKIKFEISPSKITATKGSSVSLNYNIINNSKELLRNVRLTNESETGIKLSYEETYENVNFIEAGKSKQGEIKIKLPKNLPNGLYKIRSTLKASTLDSSVNGIHYKEGSELNKPIFIEVVSK